jgi:DNA modification methylase
MDEIFFGDCRDSLRAMAAAGVKVQTCVTSPPYFGLRDYGHDGQIGLEETPERYIAELVEVFRCVRDVLADDGTLWVNIGDSYNNNPSTSLIPRSEQGMGSGVFCLPSETQVQARRAKPNKAQPLIDAGIKKKDLIGIPWMLAFALRADGWYLRQEIIWHKPNPMPESVTDRCTKAHEQIFLLSKSPRYYYDSEAVKEPAIRAGAAAGGKGRKDSAFGAAHGDVHRGSLSGEVSETRNRRSVWTVAPRPYKGAHFAVYPPELIEPCILAGSAPGDVVLDPFMGSGTTAATAIKHGRRFIGCELNSDYKPLQDERIAEARAALNVPVVERRKRPRARKHGSVQTDLFGEAA